MQSSLTHDSDELQSLFARQPVVASDGGAHDANGFPLYPIGQLQTGLCFSV
jgi:hypothetical protein